MKLSISLPNPMAQEIKALSKESERPLSWWIQRAWEVARGQLLNKRHEAKRSHRKAMKMLESLRGVIKDDFPGMDSVTLSHRAFTLEK